MSRRMIERLVRTCVCEIVVVAGLMVVTDTPHAVAAVVTINVTTTADDFTTNGNCTLREAVKASNTDQPIDACPAGGPADQIVLPTGTYTLSIPGVGEDADLSGDLDITGTVTLVGTSSVIDAAGIDRVLHVLPGAAVTVIGITLRGGYVQANGDPSNRAEVTGGGVYDDGSLTLQDSTVTGNVADQGDVGPASGAGISVNDTRVLVLSRAHVDGNAFGNTYPSGSGGGIANFGKISMTESTVSGNQAWSVGGGIYNAGQINGVGSTISGNRAGCYDCDSEGAGIYNSGSISLNNSTISSNAVNAGDYSSAASGGGLFSAGSATLASVTIADNSVGHLCNTHCFTVPTAGGISNSGTLSALNTIIAHNSVTETQSPPFGGTSVTTPSCATARSCRSWSASAVE